MIIEVSHQIEFDEREVPFEIMRKIKADLTLSNPEYINAIKFSNRPVRAPQHIHLYRTEEDKIILPRGYGNLLIGYLRGAGIKYQLIDNRVILPKIKFNSSIQLRDYQEEAVAVMVLHKQGGIVAPCGSGKTMIILSAMERIGQPSLVVTHTKELAEQFIDRACAVFDITRDEVGFIGDGKFSIGDRLTIALIQTLSKCEIDLSEKFGAVFVDEAHHLPAKSFFIPVGQFKALHRFWVSATPERADGLSDMIYAASGPVLHTIDQSQVPTIIPRLRVVETKFICDEFEYVKIIGDLIKDKERNKQIVQTIVGEAEGNYSLILSERIEHLEILKELLHKALPGLNIDILTGSLKKKDRADVMKRVQNKEVDILLATQLAREGLDIPFLNRLFLTVPKKSPSSVQQEVGRIMRPYPGKSECLVVDFWDSKHGMLKSQYWKRREVYGKIGMETDHRKTVAK